MYQRRTGSYDEIPEGMKRYINHYGCHFNNKLCEEAVSRMYTKKEDGEEKKLKPYSKEQVDNMLEGYGIRIKRNKLYDAVYVANMCANDYLGRSVPDEKHMAMFIKDMLDDPDAEEGFVFNRFYADTMYMNYPVDWEDML